MSEPIQDIWWTSGLCSTFAARLQQRFGGEIWGIINHSNKYPKDDYLWHCYYVIGDSAYDANGWHSIAEAANTSLPIPEMDKDNDVVFVWQKLSIDWFEENHEDYNPFDFPAADGYIESHRNLFTPLLT